MTNAAHNVIDCDLHPAVPGIKALLPYMSDYWRENFVLRGIDGFNPASHVPTAPVSCRPDWRPPQGGPGTDLGLLQSQALDAFGIDIAICNCLYGGQMAVSEGMAVAMCRAVNDWLAAEWLDRDPRLRASIVVPLQNPLRAVEEIERLAGDQRFVQILLPAAAELMLGRQYYWPIYEAAQRHDLPVGLHAGSMYRHAITSAGWPTHYVQDYVSLTQGIESQLLSLVYEGVFGTYPDLKVVLLESGVSWLPAFLWRARKTWRGLRAEVPWVKESPEVLIRRHVRLTIQPFDTPDDPTVVERLVEQIDSDDMLLFATDYPHWQFDGDYAVPAGISSALAARIKRDNPLATYSRLRVADVATANAGGTAR